MSFRQWLNQYRHDESALGDLARDAAADPEWPRGPGSLTRYEDHLRNLDACDAAIETLHSAWDAYRQGTH